MSAVVANASPVELAALWRLDLLTARDVVQVCQTWLEQDFDETAPDVAVLAGEIDPRIDELRRPFERALVALTGAALTRDDALLIALRLHLAVALAQPDERFMQAMDLAIARFGDASEHRLVVHPARLTDRPDQTFAQQELGLEYIYGLYWELDDLLRGEMMVTNPAKLEIELRRDLREEVQTLHDHLRALGLGRTPAAILVERLSALPRPADVEVREQEPLPERPGL
ncbi:MAG TPA: hypothetical protein VN157_13705 [Caulobacter sp.]|nr:hypothetical protein [Caulobacter sp.]